MIPSLLENYIFQTCAIGLEEIYVNVLSLLLGSHVRTGMEESLLYQREVSFERNVHLIKKIVQISNVLGRRVATGE